MTKTYIIKEQNILFECVINEKNVNSQPLLLKMVSFNNNS